MRGERFENMAILYRTNAQSRVFEERLKQRNIPYAIVRGISFYDRKEIKDLMAYLKVVDSGIDDIAVKRIINVPKRGIGQTTVNRIQDYAMEREIGFLDAVMQAETIPDLGRSAAKLTRFADMIRDFRAYLDENSISALLNYIIDQTGYSEELIREGTDEAKSRLDDIDELLNDIINYDKQIAGCLHQHVSILLKATILDQVLHDATQICRKLPEAAAMAENTFIDDYNFQRWKDVFTTGLRVFMNGIDGATSVAQTSGSGGTSSDMPWREKDEDYLHWAYRAMRYAHAKHYPGNKLKKSKSY